MIKVLKAIDRKIGSMSQDSFNTMMYAILFPVLIGFLFYAFHRWAELYLK